MEKSKEIFISKTGKLFPPHIEIIGYFLLVFIPLVLFDVINIELNLGFIIIGLVLSIIFSFSTTGIIVDFRKAAYREYYRILFIKLGNWQSTNTIQKVLFTKGNVGWVANYGIRFNVNLSAKSHVVYLKIGRKKHLAFSGSFDETFKNAAKIATGLNLPVHTDQLVKGERNVQVLTLNNI